MVKTTELMQLLKTGNSDAARKLIAKMKKGGKKKQLAKELVLPDESSQGQTVMHFCAAQNFVEFIHDLADMGAPIDSLDDRGFTPMHLAAGSGRTSAVAALLGKGADPNVASHNGDTPLHLACSGGHASTVESLIAEKANATGFNVSGHTPLDMASQHGHTNAVAALLRSGQFPQSYLQRSDIPHTALLLAAKSGHTEVIGLLVKHGFDINRKLPGASGNCFHEAALYGKVETVKYLLMLGADVQALNHQGHTALDIVNMYTDPRSAGVMKQVLQDAMAEQARKRIAQQAQPPQPHSTYQTPTTHQGHAGHQPHMAHQGHPSQQQQYQRHPSQENHYHQPTARSQPGHSSQGHQPHAAHSGYPSHSSQSPPGPSPTLPKGVPQQAGFSYIMPGLVSAKPRSDSDPDPRAHHSNPSTQSGQAYQQQQQQPQHSGYHSQAQAHASYAQQRSHTIQGQPQSNQSYSQPRSQGHPGMAQKSQSIQGQPPHDQQRVAQQPQSQYSQHQQYAQQLAQQNQQYQGGHPSQQRAYPSQQGGQYNQQPGGQYNQQQGGHPASQQGGQYSQQQGGHPSQQQYAQQQYQQPQPAQGTPDTAHRDVGGAAQPMDLASQIKAKLATRKPMATSPTRKDFPPEDDPFRRSNTLTMTSASDIRQAVLRRRNSLTDRSSSSPDRESYDRSNPPTLPRRGHAGPPSFTPLPPSEGEDPASKVAAAFEKPKRKPQPKPPPQEPEMDNELLKKLMRRQDRIQKAEVEGVESLDPKIEEPVAEEPSKAVPPTGPPPIPERKTASLTLDGKELSPPPPPQSQPPPSTAPPPSQPSPAHEPPKPEQPVGEVPKPKTKPKAKPPPPKPKKEEPEVPPWQLELQKRKERRAQDVVEIAESMMVEKKEDGLVASTEAKAEGTAVPNALVKELTPPPPAPPPSQPPPEPVPAEKQEIPPPAVIKQKPSPSARRKVDSKPSVPPPEEPKLPPPPPIETIPPPPVSAPPSSQNIRALLPQNLPMASQEKSQSGQPGTPSSELSRSTSMSSLPTTGSPLQISEPISIGDWLSSYKLSDYLSVFERAGYNTTDFLKGITTDELTEIGVQKPGHKKKIMTALSTIHHKEHLLLEKPASVTAWLTSLGLVEYKEALLDAGYDDIDFISDISSEELQDIGITKKGHLKRFMRGIAELVEVSKSAPPTPSPIPRNQHANVNGHATPPPIENSTSFFEDCKTPEPQDDEKTIIAPPTGFDEPDLKRNSQNFPIPPVATKPKRLSKDEVAMMNSDLLQTRADSKEREGGVPSDGSGGLNKMRQMLEQQMGTNQSTDSLEMSVGSETSEPPVPAKASSRSPSHSPRVARKPKLTAPPPAPKRSSQTQLSAASLSSSSTSLSSTSEGQDKRASGDVSQIMDSPPKVPAKKKKTAEVSRVSVTGMDAVDLGGDPSSLSSAHKTYSVEDITAALDDMVSEDEFLNTSRLSVETKSDPRVSVRSEGREAVKSVEVVPPVKKISVANDELDALSKALQGFDSQDLQNSGEEETGEADQLLADIDDMLADLNTKLDFMSPEELGTDV